MRGWLALVAVSLASVSVVGVAEAARPVTVYLERHGKVVSDSVKIPAYGGGDRAWAQIVGCVADRFSAFQVDVTDRKPRGEHITVVIGGWASQLGLSNQTTNGVGPYNGSVLRNATVFVFSKVGTGEADVANLCAVASHEAAHAMGLDHTYKCGDIMSYFNDRCGPQRFLDVDAPCGEYRARECGDGEASQNSYRKLGQLVGFRASPAPDPDDDSEAEGEDDPWGTDDDGSGDADDETDDADDESDDADDIWGDDADSDSDSGEAPSGHNCGSQAQRQGQVYRYRVYRVYVWR